MIKSEAIAELELLRANVKLALDNIRHDASLSQRFREAKLAAYTRRVEALTLAIEALGELR